MEGKTITGGMKLTVLALHEAPKIEHAEIYLKARQTGQCGEARIPVRDTEMRVWLVDHTDGTTGLYWDSELQRVF